MTSGLNEYQNINAAKFTSERGPERRRRKRYNTDRWREDEEDEEDGLRVRGADGGVGVRSEEERLQRRENMEEGGGEQRICR